MFLLLNYFRRTWRSGLLCCLALFAFQAFICRVFQQIVANGGAAPMARLMPKWAQSLFGIDPSAIGALTGVLSISYQHPFQLGVLFAVPIAAATALLAGDIEQRTVGLLLARPLSRFSVVMAAAIVCLVWPALAIASAVGGTFAGVQYFHLKEAIDVRLIVTVAINLYLLVAAVGLVTLAISAMHSQRGDAVGWAVTLVLLMYVWNFLAQLWAASGSLPNYSLFRYFAPASILLRGAQPVQDMVVLACVATAALVVSALVYRYRDITV